MLKKESIFQANLKKELKKTFDGCIVAKLDAQSIQGIPDLIVFHSNGKWASLECKDNKKANRQPNQDRYVNKMNQMSFSRFIYPENKDEVISELKEFFEGE